MEIGDVLCSELRQVERNLATQAVMSVCACMTWPTSRADRLTQLKQRRGR